MTASTEEPQAYEFYLKGRYFWNRRTPQDLRRAIELFDSAVALDTAYAAAYAGLALTYTVLPSYGWRNEDAYPNASGAARRALALDPTSAEAHVAQAMVHRGEFSWLEAEQAFLRAIEFNPGEPSAHQWYGQLLHVLGRGAQGLEELRRAHQLDPLSLLISFHLGWELHLLRRYEEASIELRDAAELNPAHPLPAIGLGFVEAEMGRIEAALGGASSALRDAAGVGNLHRDRIRWSRRSRGGLALAPGGGGGQGLGTRPGRPVRSGPGSAKVRPPLRGDLGDCRFAATRGPVALGSPYFRLVRGGA